jgi:serine protease inhibitor
MHGKAILAVSAIAALAVTAAPPHRAAAQHSLPMWMLTGAYNASARELIGHLASPDGNIVLSPYAIGSVMSMALAGARGDTAREMASVLEQSLDREQIDAVTGQVIAALNSYDRSIVRPPVLLACN